MIQSAKMIHISWALHSNEFFQIQLQIHTRHPRRTLLLSRLLPVIVPALGRRGISLHTGILDREKISEDALLVHRDTEQLAAIGSTSAQLLTCLMHALVLAHHLELLLAALLGLEQLPGAVDGPVTEVTVAREAEGTRRERVVEEVADQSYEGMVSCGFLRYQTCLGWGGLGARDRARVTRPRRGG